ncbi:MAG: ATP-binding cassette domain-containing protein [Treponema sp.]|nr:ATP-binding cassette domain-containing protein [Treponema sp.]
MVTIQNVTKKYNNRTVLKDFSLSIERGKISVLIGPSGCGKSTLLNIIAGLEEIDTGTLCWTHTPPDKIGYVFQEDRLLPWFTVGQNIKAVDSFGNDERVLHYLKAVGLEGFENYYPSELSGGMRQRCAIARALYYGSDFLLMDEPFSSLDYIIRQKLISDTLEISKTEGTTILFVTHDLEEAMKIADTIFVLSKDPCSVMAHFSIASCTSSEQSHCALKHTILEMIES